MAVCDISFQAPEQHQQTHAMSMALAASSVPTHYAALTTRNAFRSPSVEYLQGRKNKGQVQALLVNNKISNAGSKTGYANMTRLQQRLSSLLHVEHHAVVPLSTGIIGWTLPINEMVRALPSLVARLGSDSFVDFARAIMTTDRFVKVRSCTFEEGSIVALCKGAGMIEPNLHTMLVFFFTDIVSSNRELYRILCQAVAESFMQISVDGDQSTSDVVMMQSSNIIKQKNSRQFVQRIGELAEALALDVVRNGEGAGHIVKVVITGARSIREGKELAKCLLYSRLVATAIAGNDPNLGRLIARIGQYFGEKRKKIDFVRVGIAIESHSVFARGHFVLTPIVEEKIADAFRKKGWDSQVNGYPIMKPPIEIVVQLGRGHASACAYGTDLTKEYVHINADYRS